MKLWSYIQGNRTGKEAHHIEREAMLDPFLADALEGYEKTQGNHQREAAKLQKKITQLQNRSVNKLIGKRLNHLKIWIIAAGILIVVGVGTWLLMNDSQMSKEFQSITQADIQAPIPASPQEALQVPSATAERLSENPVLARAVPNTTAAEEEVAEAQAAPTLSKKIMADSMTRTTPDTSIAEISKPYPVIGLEAYMDYIQRNLEQPTDEECRNTKGSVVVVFKIGQSGRPYNIRVTQGLCTSNNKEAIRLIINGPEWKKGTASDEATVTINF